MFKFTQYYRPPVFNLEEAQQKYDAFEKANKEIKTDYEAGLEEAVRLAIKNLSEHEQFSSSPAITEPKYNFFVIPFKDGSNNLSYADINEGSLRFQNAFVKYAEQYYFICYKKKTATLLEGAIVENLKELNAIK